MLEGSTEAIHGPTCHHVDLTPGDHGHERVEAGSLVAALGSRDAFIGEGGDDGPAETIRHSLEFEPLVLDRLLIGADPKVEGDALAHRADYSRSAAHQRELAAQLDRLS